MKTHFMLAAVVTLCSACGGGDSGAENNVPITSKADALRELSSVNYTISTYSDASDGLSGNGQTAKNHKSTRPRGLAGIAKSSRSKEVRNCDSSGTVDNQSGSKSYVFDYFDTSQRAVDFDSAQSNNCTATFNTTTIRIDGFVESGYTDTASSSGYDYVEIGDNGGTVTLELSDSAESVSVVMDVSGSQQGFFTSTTDDLRTNVSLSASVNDNGDIQSGTLSLGNSQTPLKQVINSDSFTIDGPYSVSATGCPTASGVIATPQVLTVNDQEDYINGGQLRLTKGSESVTFTFNLDGSATYQTGSGGSGTITRQELENAGDDLIC